MFKILLLFISLSAFSQKNNIYVEYIEKSSYLDSTTLRTNYFTRYSANNSNYLLRIKANDDSLFEIDFIINDVRYFYMESTDTTGNIIYNKSKKYNYIYASNGSNSLGIMENVRHQYIPIIFTINMKKDPIINVFKYDEILIK